MGARGGVGAQVPAERAAEALERFKAINAAHEVCVLPCGKEGGRERVF